MAEMSWREIRAQHLRKLLVMPKCQYRHRHFKRTGHSHKPVGSNADAKMTFHRNINEILQAIINNHFDADMAPVEMPSAR